MLHRTVCFGELLLRLGAPGRERFLQSPELCVHVGGAEANVALALAQWGHDVAFVSAVPDNALADAALAVLRGRRVDVTRVQQRPGRMALYFLEIGAGARASKVVYDRAGSSFSRTGDEHYDWRALLAGAHRLHLSGITPALSLDAAKAAIAAASAARELGMDVVFDGNFRPSLWAVRDTDPQPVLRELFALATTAFAGARDIDLVLGTQASTTADPYTDFERAASRAFDAFPSLQRLVCTTRTVHTADRYSLGALHARRDGAIVRADDLALDGIVDRIGGGDAFAAGVLHGIDSGWTDARAVAFGLAASVLKHTVPGDFLIATEADVMAVVEGEPADVRR
ncbi:sugar kinase [Lysobacter sp. HA18]